MFRCVCSSLFFVLLSGVMCADVPLLEPQEIVSTFPSTTESNTPTLITQGSNDGITGNATTSEPATSNSTETAESTTNPINVTTVPPITQHTNATAAPTTQTNATTVISTTAATSTPAPTTSPAVPNPTVGDYIVRATSNASVCLMAKMGLQFSFVTSVGASVQTVNLDPSPNVTTSEGVCGSYGTDATLMLTSDKIKVQFTFSNVTNRFYLRGLNFSVDIGNGSTFDAANSTLSLWEASLGSSYMCRKEQSYNITELLTLNTFELQVQPFDVTNDKFSTAEECFLDADLSFLVPIAVGVALGFLIILVLISYLIGRRKSRTGYQSV